MEKSIINKRAKIFYLFWSIKNKGTANWKAARALSLSSNRLYINKPVIKVFISSIHQEWRDYKFKMEKNELQRIPIPESFWNLKISLSPKPNKIYFIHFHPPRRAIIKAYFNFKIKNKQTSPFFPFPLLLITINKTGKISYLLPPSLNEYIINGLTSSE